MQTKGCRDLAAAVAAVLSARHPEPFLTLRLPERDALFQLTRQKDELRLFLNTSGHGGTFDELRLALADLDVEVRQLEGWEGAEYVALRGSPGKCAEKGGEVLRAVFGSSATMELETLYSLSQLEEAGTGRVAWKAHEGEGSGLLEAFEDRAVRHPSLGQLSLLLLLVGGCATAVAVWRAQVLAGAWRGEWIGGPLPTAVEVVLGLGLLAFPAGLVLGLFWALRHSAAGRRVASLLHAPLVGEGSPWARWSTRLVRGMVETSWKLKVTIGSVLLAAAAVYSLWTAFSDPLVASILGVTGLVLVLVYAFGRRA